jgi:hypothetical protein
VQLPQEVAQLQFVTCRPRLVCAPSPPARVRHPELQKQRQTQNQSTSTSTTVVVSSTVAMRQSRPCE